MSAAGPDLALLDGVRWQGVPVRGERGHALLAALALAAPRTLSVGDLVEQVWGDAPPDHPEKALQVLVSRTRAQTAPDALVHAVTGYRLGLREDQVDALRLRGLVEAAGEARRAGDLDVARLAAREALALPVTTPLHDGPLADLVEGARRRRSAAGRLLGSVLLARGDYEEALPLLESALAEEPGDEDRVAEVLRAESSLRGVPAALERYARYAEKVGDTLGAEPGEPLKRLHAELLARDAPVREGLKYDAAPMVGRDRDVTRVRGLLESSRVVSLVGAGGLGKTRMAHLVGRLAQHPVVHFVELAGVNAPAGVLPEIASALGVREPNANRRAAPVTGDLRARVAQHLSGVPTLLILDNCEHLIDAVASLVAFLVATTDATQVLTTSRAPLGIAAERVYLLPQLDEAEAAELFGQRARSARFDVRLDPEQVAALVGRLDGLPLAIELAAAKARVMSVAEISDRLADRFALLSGGDRSAPDRHQTLEAVIDWSWNLLREEDQDALRRLSVFPDGFSLAGAAALLGGDPLYSLAELVDQSLLVVREGRQVRYRFLETVREYGLNQLVAAGTEQQARERLRSWACDTARDLGIRLFTTEQISVMAEIGEEVGNLTAAMRAALEAADEPALVPLVATLCDFWTIEGDHLGVLALIQPVLELLGRASTEEITVEHGAVDELRTVLAALVINATIFTGRAPDQALDRLRSLPPATPGTRADALSRVLLGVYREGAPDIGALAALCADPEPAVARLALQWSSQLYENNGELDQALEAGRRALATCDPVDGPWQEALIEAQLSGLTLQMGDHQQSVEHANRALPVMEQLGAVEDTVQLRCVLALAELSAGRLDRAEAELNAAAADERSVQTLGWSVAGRSGLAELALARGETERGLDLYLECIAIARARRLPGLELAVDQMPWVLLIESVALFAHVTHGRTATAGEAGRGIAFALMDVLPTLLDPAAPNPDYPVIGCSVLAVGSWHLSGPDGAPEDVALLALGHRFGYNRIMPTMAWNVVERFAEAHAPGRLAPLLATYADRPLADLCAEALELVRGIRR